MNRFSLLGVFVVTVTLGYTARPSGSPELDLPVPGVTCDTCPSAVFPPVLLSTPNCIVTWQKLNADGKCKLSGNQCIASEPNCLFQLRPLCDTACCVTQWQDGAGVWNLNLCTVPTPIWQTPCETAALGVNMNWRVFDACNASFSGVATATFFCGLCDP